MKKFRLPILSIILTTLLLTGCDFFNRDKFDEALLPGYWQEGTLHEYYNANGTGYTWDTQDDVTEDEAQPFTWTLSGSTLTQNHKMEMGGIVPKTYTVTILNAGTLAYQDDYGTTHHFSRQ